MCNLCTGGCGPFHRAVMKMEAEPKKKKTKKAEPKNGRAKNGKAK
jgi:hypothetical protein